MSKTPRDPIAVLPCPMPLRKVSLLVGLALAAALPAAQAQEEGVPLYLRFTQQFSRDTNLLRQKNNPVSDTTSSTQATLGLDKNYGRQHYTLDATIAKNMYKKYSQYDNDSYSTSGSFSTEIASDFRLTLDGDASRALPSFEDSSENRVGRNTRGYLSYGGELRYGLHGRLSVNGGLRQSKVDYQISESENKKATAGYVGLRYLPNELMYYGVTYTRTQAEFVNRLTPVLNGGIVDNILGEKVDSDNIAFGASWKVTGFSLFNGSIGYTKENYQTDPRRDFSGVTGSAAWRYIPTDKTSFKLAWSRDTNNSGSRSVGDNYALGAASGYVSSNRVINNFAASVNHELTSKINLNASYAVSQYKEQFLTVLTGSVVGTDQNSLKSRLNTFSFGADYQPLRSVALGCSLAFYDRTQSRQYEAYDGRTTSCYAAFILQ